jgi:hypothetical protein
MKKSLIVITLILLISSIYQFYSYLSLNNSEISIKTKLESEKQELNNNIEFANFYKKIREKRYEKWNEKLNDCMASYETFIFSLKNAELRGNIEEILNYTDEVNFVSGCLLMINEQGLNTEVMSQRIFYLNDRTLKADSEAFDRMVKNAKNKSQRLKDYYNKMGKLKPGMEKPKFPKL